MACGYAWGQRYSGSVDGAGGGPEAIVHQSSCDLTLVPTQTTPENKAGESFCKHDGGVRALAGCLLRKLLSQSTAAPRGAYVGLALRALRARHEGAAQLVEAIRRQ